MGEKFWSFVDVSDEELGKTPKPTPHKSDGFFPPESFSVLPHQAGEVKDWSWGHGNHSTRSKSWGHSSHNELGPPPVHQYFPPHSVAAGGKCLEQREPEFEFFPPDIEKSVNEILLAQAPEPDSDEEL